jgi:hypothetical protein
MLYFINPYLPIPFYLYTHIYIYTYIHTYIYIYTFRLGRVVSAARREWLSVKAQWRRETAHINLIHILIWYTVRTVVYIPTYSVWRVACYAGITRTVYVLYYTSIHTVYTMQYTPCSIHHCSV